MRYQFIEDQRRDYPIKVLCNTLEVSLSGYYTWRTRPMSKHQREDALLADRLQAAFSAIRQVYGSPRLPAEMQAQGLRCSRKRVARLMKERAVRSSSSSSNSDHKKRTGSAYRPEWVEARFHGQLAQ